MTMWAGAPPNFGDGALIRAATARAAAPSIGLDCVHPSAGLALILA
jgi:hypothetical protein